MITIDAKSFSKDMNNLVNYSIGFLDGIHSGKKAFLDGLGTNSVEIIKSYIDSMARVDSEMLHHIYEWNRVGSPDARLFDIDYTISNLGLSIKSSFRQSTSVRDGSTVPFYDKARIMESGIPVTIKPKTARVLSFDDNGEQVFTKKPVRVENPGGASVQGGLEKTLESFFNFFSQSFLQSSGIASYLENPVAYKKNLPAGKRAGKSAGVKVGYRWIVNAGVIK